eukprot:4453208-Amphidinium_carterae.1
MAQPWLLSTAELDPPSSDGFEEEYAETLIVALFWSGLPSEPVASCLLAVHPSLVAHRTDFQEAVLEGFGSDPATVTQLGVIQMNGDILGRLVDGVPADASSLPLWEGMSPDAVLPTGGDVYQVIELPRVFAGGVCAHLGAPAGGLMMEVQGMSLMDEPYHSGDEAAHLGVGAWQAALVPARGSTLRPTRGQASAKRGSVGGRSVAAKTSAVPLFGASAPPAKALGSTLGGESLPGSARTRRSPRAAAKGAAPSAE